MLALPVQPPAPAAASLRDLPDAAFDALYVHVPFCAHKCHYCDFYSITRQSEGRMVAFVDRVLAEAATWSHADADFKTIFFGGGTPSLLPPREMARLIAGLRDRLDLSRVTEWTVETNPGSATAAYFDALAAGGVDRVSFGAQSFDSRELDALERDHRGGDVPAAVDLAARSGIPRRSVDLLYAIPGQTIRTLRRSIDAVLAIDVEHVSCYGLTYEPNTPLYVRKRLGRVVATPENEEVEMFRETRRRLAAAGLAAYEISNFARPGRECRHNLAYWHGDAYLGLGPSAASHLAGVRWRNAPHLGQWERAVDRGVLPAIDEERLSPSERAAELAWLNLRTTAGIDVAEFGCRTGKAPESWFGDRLAALADNGVIETTATHVRLTEAGLTVADAVAAELMPD